MTRQKEPIMQSLHCIRQFLEDILFPPLCLSCRTRLETEERARWLCRNCTLPFDFPAGFFCPFCKRRSPSIPSCHSETRFSGIAPWDYRNKRVRELLHLLKYKGIKAAATPIGKELASYFLRSMELGGTPLSNFVTIPIPLHPRKLRRRGFNQSLLLTRALNLAELPILEGTLFRIKATSSQTTFKDSRKRMENIFGSFMVTDPEPVRGKNILLVDDVLTSGATMREAARVLKNAGAKKIIGLIAARA